MSQFKFNFIRRNALTNFTRDANADGAPIRNRVSYFTVVYLL